MDVDLDVLFRDVDVNVGPDSVVSRLFVNRLVMAVEALEEVLVVDP